MEFDTLYEALEIIRQNSYFFIFLLMFIEGPIVSAAAAFASSLGYFNVYLIFLLSFLGCFIPDVIYFVIGKTGNKSLIKKLENRYGEEKVRKLERKFQRNKKKALIAIKLTPFASIPGMTLSGLTGMKYKDFLVISSLITAIISGIFVISGYYFGVIFDSLVNYLNLAAGIILLIIGVSFFYPFITKKTKQLKEFFNKILT